VTLTERPIFLVGAPRSGTTLLRYVLCSHPRIYIPPESNFMPRVLGQHPTNTLEPSEAVRMLETIMTYQSFFRDWQSGPLNPTELVEGILDLHPATVLDAVYSEYARQYGAKRWGDKSPIYTMHIDAIARAFPTGQFIHIIRDARDAALSMRQAYKGTRFFYMDVYYAACSWKTRVTHALSSGSRLDRSRYLQVRYEDLVARPEMVIREICAFLREEYEPAMTEPGREASRHFHSTGIHRATTTPINTRASGRWRREMTVTDQRLVQSVAGDLLNALGYEVRNLGRMAFAERARLAALWVKYETIQIGRRVLQSAGLFHPTSLLERLHLGKGGDGASRGARFHRPTKREA
jgi:hypothetical protein